MCGKGEIDESFGAGKAQEEEMRTNDGSAMTMGARSGTSRIIGVRHGSMGTCNGGTMARQARWGYRKSLRAMGLLNHAIASQARQLEGNKLETR